MLLLRVFGRCCSALVGLINAKKYLFPQKEQAQRFFISAEGVPAQLAATGKDKSKEKNNECGSPLLSHMEGTNQVSPQPDRCIGSMNNMTIQGPRGTPDHFVCAHWRRSDDLSRHMNH
jgi:hypothetical protein